MSIDVLSQRLHGRRPGARLLDYQTSFYARVSTLSGKKRVLHAISGGASNITNMSH